MSREVLAPPLQRMSNSRSYRVNLVHEDFGGSKRNSQQAASQGEQQKGYVESDLYADDDEGDDFDDCSIEELSNGSFKLELHIASAFYGGLIGFKGSTKQRIETETQTEIQVPRKTDKSTKVVIKGKLRSNVCTAKRKIQLLVESLRKRMRPTHFLAVALNTGELKQNYIQLKQQIIEAQYPGIDEELLTKDNCIHLTLQTCVLLDDEERERAVQLLKNCRQFLTGLKTPLNVHVRGLEIMNDDPSATRVLYACVNSPELQQFADQCSKFFVKNGLAATDNFVRDNVKLHMTILKKSGGTFDAREILKRFGDYDFGAAQCNEVHLCVMKSSTDDFYRISGTLNF